MAIILLRSLPSSFKDFRTLMFGKYSLKLEDVIQAFQSYAILDDITESSQVPYAKGKEREQKKTGRIATTGVGQNPKRQNGKKVASNVFSRSLEECQDVTQVQLVNHPARK